MTLTITTPTFPNHLKSIFKLRFSRDAKWGFNPNKVGKFRKKLLDYDKKTFAAYVLVNGIFWFRIGSFQYDFHTRTGKWVNGNVSYVGTELPFE